MIRIDNSSPVHSGVVIVKKGVNHAVIDADGGSVGLWFGSDTADMAANSHLASVWFGVTLNNETPTYGDQSQGSPGGSNISIEWVAQPVGSNKLKDVWTVTYQISRG